MVDGAEVVGDAVLAAVTNQEDVNVTQLAAAVRAGPRRALDRRRLIELTRLPMRSLDRPWHDVLQTTEHGAAVPSGLVQAKSVVLLDACPTPGATLVGHDP